MTAPRPASPMVPTELRKHLLNELEQLCADTVRKLCQMQRDAGQECDGTPAGEVLRQVAVSGEIARIACLLEDAVFRKAVPRTTQAAIGRARGATQQAVSQRIARQSKTSGQ